MIPRILTIYSFLQHFLTEYVVIRFHNPTHIHRVVNQEMNSDSTMPSTHPSGEANLIKSGQGVRCSAYDEEDAERFAVITMITKQNLDFSRSLLVIPDITRSRCDKLKHCRIQSKDEDILLSQSLFLDFVFDMPLTEEIRYANDDCSAKLEVRMNSINFVELKDFLKSNETNVSATVKQQQPTEFWETILTMNYETSFELNK